MKILFIICLLLNFSAFSSSQEFFKFGNISIKMNFNKGVYLSSDCDLMNCEAKKGMEQIGSIKIESEDLAGGKNPFSVKCTKYLKGTVLVGLDQSGNELAFCKFSDGSMFR
jgi:hypothetical protein